MSSVAASRRSRRVSSAAMTSAVWSVSTSRGPASGGVPIGTPHRMRVPIGWSGEEELTVPVSRLTRVTATLPAAGQIPPEDGSAEIAGADTARRDQLRPAMPTDRLFGWLGPLAVTLLAGVLRLQGLSKPAAVVGGKVQYTFDEVYYTKDAHDLLTFGVERGENCRGPGFVVHPPLGKWLMAISEWIFGYIGCDGRPHGDPAVGWRFASAVVGTLAVLILARTARRMFGSTLLGCFAGLLLALDGLEFVHSRTGILDIFLMFWTIAGLACLVADRDWMRIRLAVGPPSRWVLWRPWRLACALCLGAAFATKWSGGYTIVAFAALALAWDVGTRRSAGELRLARTWAVRDLPSWVGSFVVLPVIVYVVSWTGWFVTDTGFDREGRHD